MAVRRLAVKTGFSAFSAGNDELSLKYHSLDYVKEKKSGGFKTAGGWNREVVQQGRQKTMFRI